MRREVRRIGQDVETTGRNAVSSMIEGATEEEWTPLLAIRAALEVVYLPLEDAGNKPPEGSGVAGAR